MFAAGLASETSDAAMDGEALLKALTSSTTVESEAVDNDMVDVYFNSNVVAINAEKVLLHSESVGGHTLGSSQLTFRPLADFAFERSAVFNRRLTFSPPFLAYVLNGSNKEHAVKVVSEEGKRKTLCKGFNDKIVDIQFAHAPPTEQYEVLLGCIDASGLAIIFQIVLDKEQKGLWHKPLIQIKPDKPINSSTFMRFTWCPYVPEEGEEDDDEEYEEDDSASRLFVITREEQVEIFNLDMILEKYGSGLYTSSMLNSAVIRIPGFTGAITCAQLSPDGSAIALASLDGHVKFYQVYFQSEDSEEPRSLHDWTPHEGHKVTFLAFLDDRTDDTPNRQFWKFAITGSQHNSELKIWSCESWRCLQKLVFAPSPSALNPPHLSLAMDASSRFLLLCDQDRRLLYVLHFREKQLLMRAVSACEFAIPSPFLSMHVVSATSVINHEFISERDDDKDDDSDYDDDSEGSEQNQQDELQKKTAIDLYLVQPKGLQKCRIKLDDVVDEGLQDEENKKNNLTSAADAIKKEELSPMDMKPKPLSRLREDSLTLLSPEAFKVKKEPKDEVDDNSLSEEDTAARSSMSLLPPLRSGNSSPSREVEDILAESEEQGGIEGDFVITDDINVDEDDEEDEQEEEDKKPIIIQQPKKELLPTSLSMATPPDPRLLNRSLEAPFRVKSEPSEEILKEMLTLMKNQQREILNLSSEVRNLKDSLTHQEEQQQRDQKMTEKLDKALVNLEKSMKVKMDQIVRQELKKLSQQLVDGVHKSLQTEVKGKIQSCDATLSSAVSQMCLSQSFNTALANNLTMNMLPPFDAAIKDAMMRSLIPTTEKTCRALFEQLTSSVMQGLQQHQNQLKAHVDQTVSRVHRDLVPLLKNELSTCLDKHDQRLESRDSGLISALRVVVVDELRKISSSSVNNNASPSVDNVDQERHVRRLVEESKFDAAFKFALHANNLRLVVKTCEMVEPIQIFQRSKCNLTQPVLLSLVQQLAHNLDEKTETKHEWLKMAILALDQSDNDIRPHINKVLSQLENKLRQYVNNNANASMTKEMKLLLMAVPSMMADG